MAVPRSVPSVVVIAAIISLLSHTGFTAARSLSLQGDNLTRLLSKRNSWWSKKSVADTSSDYTPMIPDGSLTAEGSAVLQDSNPHTCTQLYGCYTSSCVPAFVACAARSRATGSFQMCTLDHRACAVQCLEMANGDSSMK